MNDNRLTISENTLSINSLTFGRILIASKEEIAKVFNNKKGYLDLEGVNILLSENECTKVESFLESIDN